MAILKIFFGRFWRFSRVPSSRIKRSRLASLAFISIMVFTSVLDGLMFSPAAYFLTNIDATFFDYVTMHCFAKAATAFIYALMLGAYYATFSHEEMYYLIKFRADLGQINRLSTANSNERSNSDSGGESLVCNSDLDLTTYPINAPHPSSDASDLSVAHYLFDQDLPSLLRNPSNHNRWAAYYPGGKIGIRKTQKDLYRLAARLGIPSNLLLIRWIHEKSEIAT